MTKAGKRWSKTSIAGLSLFWMLHGAEVGAQQPVDSNAAYEQAQETLRRGDLPRAIEQLETLRQNDRYHAGALLDLAYLYCRVGQKTRVNELLLSLEAEFSPPPQIMDLIHDLHQRDCHAAQRNTRWGVALGVGHDSNVNQGALVRSFPLSSGLNLELSDEFLPKASPFFSLSAYISHALDANDLVYGTFLNQRYTATSSFDLSGFSLGHMHAFTSQNWRVSTDANITLRTLGNALYYESLAGNLQVTPVPGQASLPCGFDMRLAYAHYPTRVGLDNLEASFLLPWRSQITDRLGSRLSVGWMIDKALDNRPGGDRAGPVFGAEIFYSHSPVWNFHAGWVGKWIKGETAYAPPLLPMVREQRQQFISLSAERSLTANSSLKLELQRADSADTVPIYRYKSNYVVVSWVWEGGK
jgi:hypothetical protein